MPPSPQTTRVAPHLDSDSRPAPPHAISAAPAPRITPTSPPPKPPPRKQFTPAFTFFLICLMLVTGTCNTILTKLQDMSCVRNCEAPLPGDSDTPPPRPVYYEQPVWQTMVMFFGEFLCLIAVYLGHAVHALHVARVEGRARGSHSVLSDYLFSIRQRIWGHRTGYEPLNSHDEAAAADNHTAPPASSTAAGNGTSPASPVSSTTTSTRSKVATALAIPDPVADDDSLLVAALDSEEEEELNTLDGWKRLMLWVPALCDICATTLMNVGLILIAASVYQMLRGGVVFFTALFSSVFLRRRFERFQWAALAFVVTGVAIVGASPLLEGSGGKAGQESGSGTGAVDELGLRIAGVDASVLGVGMVLLAQMFTATQFILEEKIMSGYHLHPLMAVGLEGTFGLFTSLSALLVLDALITPNNPGTYFDLREGFADTFLRNPTVTLAGAGCVASIAVFNWCGLEVTRRVSATSRSTVDTCRTILIWFISLYLGWEHFRGTQVLGFCVLLYGTMTFNGVIRPLPFLAPRPVQLPSSPPSRDEPYGVRGGEGDL
ncbi:hypothetical protein M427DRAFT_52736 [Gonapodya prolifera JEL478]|uniref:EamA domain-containing protein n=1 Tax=Gonapodya prolifera (strain JEL478) TaxID=1344416 RepID=A0A139ATT0_GONPJ|nr:hypothetical protein M427DRAFT_52736 [Gonapodya prolifera JEL478]|eukprot:KXS19905.1 hypothetical protein M427DRAFT_52736 [Gonapodya prolifera JEL478]